MAERVLIVGVSARAAAESAAHAGFDVTAIDAFADLDQHASVRTMSIPRFTARGAARAAGSIECDAVAYLSNFENHPDAVGTIAVGRALWGNPPAVLRRVRNPMLLMQALRRRGLAVPEVFVPPEHYVAMDTSAISHEPLAMTSGDRSWLVKPLASGGGHRVQRWNPDSAVPRGCYLQAFVDGTPGSVAFVASGGRSVLIGITRQLVGEAAFGVDGYRYCGSILVTGSRDDALVDVARELAHAVAAEFGVVGVNGIDFIARDGVPHAIEVNPRWCASMELVERAYDFSVFGAHAAACVAGTLPSVDLVTAYRGVGAVGKAIVFADRDVVVGDTRAWIGDPSVRDLPHPDERIRAGRPICTVFAAGADDGECHAALVQRAARVYGSVRL